MGLCLVLENGFVFLCSSILTLFLFLAACGFGFFFFSLFLITVDLETSFRLILINALIISVPPFTGLQGSSLISSASSWVILICKSASLLFWISDSFSSVFGL